MTERMVEGLSMWIISSIIASIPSAVIGCLYRSVIIFLASYTACFLISYVILAVVLILAKRLRE